MKADRKEMEASGREIHIIEFMAGLDVQLIDGQEVLRERLKLIPDGWRKFRLAVRTVETVLGGIYDTLPTKTLLHMQRLCKNGEVIIRPKPAIKMPDDVQIVGTDDLKLLVNKVMTAECAVCLRNAGDQKKCALRKAMMRIAPPRELKNGGLCMYADVANECKLGEYI